MAGFWFDGENIMLRIMRAGLEEAGLGLVGQGNSAEVYCQLCGRIWRVKLDAAHNTKLVSDWWQCPNGCNW